MQIKRAIAIGTALVMTISVIGCGSESAPAATQAPNDDVQTLTSQEQTTEVSTVADSTVVDAEVTEVPNFAENDVLILYFSAANLNDVDAVSSATPLIGGVSSVEWMANVIRDVTGGNVVRITPTEDYPLSYQDTADAAKKEADNEVHPPINDLDVDPTSYKTVFIGYPVWWYRMPMVLETLFDTYDFSGVTIIPFNTHEGSRDGGTYDMIRSREPGATVLDGIAIRGGKTGDSSAKDEIEEWLNGLDY